MFITADILRKYNACPQGIRYIERFYPNGAQMIDIIRDRHIDKEFLHWGREHLTSSDEELAAYCEVCKIINTSGYWYSQNVRDSKNIVESKNVVTSIGVFSSTDVIQSKDVIDSDGVENSEQVFSSSIVDSCTKIYRGRNIVSSTNICNSTMVAWSKNVIDSNTIFESSEIIRCDNTSSSFFCQDCTSITHCIFCKGLTNAEYCIFNKPVDKKIYELFEAQYKKYMTGQLDFIREWPQELTTWIRVLPTQKFDDWYHPIPEKFWKWVRTLPNFDSMLLYNITMLPEILMIDSR